MQTSTKFSRRLFGITVRPLFAMMAVAVIGVGGLGSGHAGTMTVPNIQPKAAWLDTGFGVEDSGMVVLNLPGDHNIAYDMAIQHDGKIVLAGVSNGDFLLVRLNLDATLDTSCGPAGYVTSGGGGFDQAHAVAIDPDTGDIYLAGAYEEGDGNFNLAMIRYNKNCEPDGSFVGSDSDDVGSAWLIKDLLGNDRDVVTDLLIAGNEILVTGHTWDTAGGTDITQYRYFLARYLLNGTPDEQFAPANIDNFMVSLGSGIIAGSSGFFATLSYALVKQSSGRLILGGVRGASLQTPALDTRFLLRGFKENGNSDSAFGEYGAETITDYEYGNFSPVLQALAADPADGVIAAGYIGKFEKDPSDTNFSPGDFKKLLVEGRPVVKTSYCLLARYTAEGMPDIADPNANYPGFGGGTGIIRSEQQGLCNDVALQRNGKIVMAGSTGNDVNAGDWTVPGDFLVQRHGAYGNPDIEFSDTFDGRATLDFSDANNPNSHDNIEAVAIQDDGKIVVVGSTTDVYGHHQIALARFLGDSVHVNLHATYEVEPPDVATQFHRLTYRIKIKNDGDYSAKHVTLTHVLPSCLGFESAPAACSYEAPTVTCKLGEIAVSTEAVDNAVSVPITVRALQAGSCTNTVSVTSNEIEFTPADNKVTHELQVGLATKMW